MLLRVGQVVRPHGVRGEIVVLPRTDDPAARFAQGSTLRLNNERDVTVSTARRAGERWLLRLTGSDSREDAEALRGSELWAEVDVEVGEYIHDAVLIGMSVQLLDGTSVGEVSAVEHYPAQDVLTVRLPGGAQVMVPFVAAIVVAVHDETRTLVLDPPVGLLDDGSAS